MSTPGSGNPTPGAWSDGAVTVSNTGKAGQSTALATGPGLITAITAIPSTLTVASQMYLLDGSDATGEFLAVLGIPAGGSFALSPGVPGIPFRRGLFVANHAGGCLMTVTYIPAYQPWT